MKCGGLMMLWNGFASSGPGNLHFRFHWFIQVFGHPRSHDGSEEAEAWLDLPAGQKHNSESTMAWLQKWSWRILEGPSQSPNLNPKKNLWWDLKNIIAACKPKNIHELKAITSENSARSRCLIMQVPKMLIMSLQESKSKSVEFGKPLLSGLNHFKCSCIKLTVVD